MSAGTQVNWQARWPWFVETRIFTAQWEDYRLSAEDLLKAEDAILANPTGAPVIPGTGGLRKMRFTPASTRQGKRGGFRICYAYFERYSGIVLVLVYSKKNMAHLSPADKKASKELLNRLERELHRKYGPS